ncbi:hypothetical protein ACFRCW_20570 [Streptomyces sp. NPDC056653]|uniref:hypothetical protein n=1 Tax=Streptomyces sp. NPDC056653 TaxID=3345894 RepID=UPI0036C599AC
MVVYFATGEPLSRGEPGEIVVRGPSVSTPARSPPMPGRPARWRRTRFPGSSSSTASR